MPTNVSLPTADILEFQRRGDAARRHFGAQQNRLDLNRTRAETDFGRTFDGENIGGGLFDRTRDAFKGMREQLPGAFVGRGLFHSGIFKNAVNKHFTQKQSALDDLEIQFTRASQDFDLTEEGLGAALSNALAQIEGDKQLRRSVYAQMIREAS